MNASTAQRSVRPAADWITDTFGSRRGLVNLLRHQTHWCVTGRLWRGSRLDDVRRLIFICKGNICRSALAGVIARAQGIAAESYGLDTTPGKPANAEMTRAARALGHDLGAHRTASIASYVPAPGDLMIGMEPAHIVSVEASGAVPARAALLGMWARPRRAYIHDPFMSSSAYFDRAAVIIQQAVTNLARELEQRHG